MKDNFTISISSVNFAPVTSIKCKCEICHGKEAMCWVTTKLHKNYLWVTCKKCMRDRKKMWISHTLREL